MSITINPNTFLNRRITEYLKGGGNPANSLKVPGPNTIKLPSGLSLVDTIRRRAPQLPFGPNDFTDPITRIFRKTATKVKGALPIGGNQFATPSRAVNPAQQLLNTTKDKIKGTGKPKPPTNVPSTPNVKPNSFRNTPKVRGRGGGGFGPALAGIGAYAQGLYEGQSQQQAIGGGFSSAGGWYAGARMGGSVPGGPLIKGAGALIGGIAGSEVGQRLYDGAYNKLTGGDNARVSADLRGSAAPGGNTAKSAALAKKQEAELHAAAQTQLTDLDRNDDDDLNTELIRRSINSSASEAAEDLGLIWGGNGSSGDGQLWEWTTDDPIDKPAVPIDSSISRGIKIGEDGLPVNDPFFAYDGPHGALGALRAKEATSNILHAAGGERDGISGNKWVKDGDKLIAISNEDAQNIMGGTITSQQFLKDKLSAIQAPGSEMGGQDQNQQDELSRALTQHQAWEKQQKGYGPEIYKATEGPVTLESFQPYVSDKPMGDAQSMFNQYQDLHEDQGLWKADAFATATRSARGDKTIKQPQTTEPLW